MHVMMLTIERRKEIGPDGPSAGHFWLCPEHVPRNEEDIRRALAQTPHEIWIPLRAKRNVHPDAPAIAHQALLQVAADPIEHLKFERLGWYFFRPGKRFCFADYVLVMRGHAVINAAFHQRLHQLDIV